MSELRRYWVQQWTGEGWAELGRFDSYAEADELACSVRASGAVGIRLWDAQLGTHAWSVLGGTR